MSHEQPTARGHLCTVAKRSVTNNPREMSWGAIEITCGSFGRFFSEGFGLLSV